MTMDELNSHARARRELEDAENLKASLVAKVELKATRLSGMPHAPGYRDTLGTAMAYIMDELPKIEEHIEILKDRIALQEIEINAFIDDIPDPQTRVIFRLRFQGGRSWDEVATLIGCGNTADSVRKRCQRYLRQKLSGNVR